MVNWVLVHFRIRVSEDAELSLLLFKCWVPTYVMTGIACESHHIAVQITYDVCTMQISATQSLWLKSHSHQNGAGHFFWSTLESDRMGVHTHAIWACTIWLFALRYENWSGGVINFLLTPAAVGIEHRFPHCPIEVTPVEIRLRSSEALSNTMQTAGQRGCQIEPRCCRAGCFVGVATRP